MKKLESKVSVEKPLSSNENRSRRDDCNLADDRMNIISLKQLQISRLTTVRLPLMRCRQKEQLTNAHALIALQSYSGGGGGTGEISCQTVKSRGFDSDGKSDVTKKVTVEVMSSDSLGQRKFIDFGSVVLERLRSKLSNGRQNQAKRKSDGDADLCNDQKKRKMESAMESQSPRSSILNENTGDQTTAEGTLSSAVSEIDTAPIGAEKSEDTVEPKLILHLRQSMDNQWQLKENTPTKKHPVSEFCEADDVADRAAVKQIVVEVAWKQKLRKNLVTYSNRHRVVLADSNRLKPEESNALNQSRRLVDSGLENNERNLFAVFTREISSLRESSDLVSAFKSNEVLPAVPLNDSRNDNLEIGNNGMCLRHEASSEAVLERTLLGDDDEFGLVSPHGTSLGVKKCLRSVCRPLDSSQLHNSESYPKTSANISRWNAAEVTMTSASHEATSAVLPWPSSVVALVRACLNDGTQSRSHFTAKVFLSAISGFCTPFSYVPPDVLSIILKKLVEVFCI